MSEPTTSTSSSVNPQVKGNEKLSKVWTFFEKVEDEKDKKIYTKCKINNYKID